PLEDRSLSPEKFLRANIPALDLAVLDAGPRPSASPFAYAHASRVALLDAYLGDAQAAEERLAPFRGARVILADDTLIGVLTVSPRMPPDLGVFGALGVLSPDRVKEPGDIEALSELERQP